MSTWKPHVAPVGPSPVKPGGQGPVTKTSLTYKGPAPQPIGTGHNTAAKPFGTIPHVSTPPEAAAPALSISKIIYRPMPGDFLGSPGAFAT